jgi:hypothetical protein
MGSPFVITLVCAKSFDCYHSQLMGSSFSIPDGIQRVD